jgi:hypothetical protein
MKHLNINDIIVNNEIRAHKRKESLDKVLDMCYKKIENSSKLDNIACFFDVPEFVIGFPLFNLNECIVYVYNHLINSGFTAQYIFPRILYVSWVTPHYVDHIKQRMEPRHEPMHENLNKYILTLGTPSQTNIQPHQTKTQRKQSPPPRARVASQKKTTVLAQSPKHINQEQVVKIGKSKSIAEYKANGRCILNLT